MISLLCAQLPQFLSLGDVSSAAGHWLLSSPPPTHHTVTTQGKTSTFRDLLLRNLPLLEIFYFQKPSTFRDLLLRNLPLLDTSNFKPFTFRDLLLRKLPLLEIFYLETLHFQRSFTQKPYTFRDLLLIETLHFQRESRDGTAMAWLLRDLARHQIAVSIDIDISRTHQWPAHCISDH